MTDSFVFYRSYFEAISDLDDYDKLILFEAIAEYSLNDNEPNLTGLQATLFKLIKPQIDSNKKKRKDGKNGGRPPKKTNGSQKEKPVVIENQNQWFEKNKPNGNGNDNVNANVNGNKKFTPPQLFEVIEYFSENGYSEQAATKAFNYYNVAEWKDSNGKQVKNWKQKMQMVWFKDEYKDKPKTKEDGTDPNYISPTGLKGTFEIEQRGNITIRNYHGLHQYEYSSDGGKTWNKRDKP